MLVSNHSKIQAAQKVYEQALRYNSAQVKLWELFIDFSLQNHISEEDTAITKQIFERAIDNVGRHMQAGAIWLKYIDFETSLLHMAFVNLLCYMAVKTPLLDQDEVIEKYTEVLTNFYDSIMEDLQGQSEAGQQIPAKYHDQ
mmetsp:Transcript_26363/g.18697  ORF Transcript_26363/g.18697 Transcript_26363/m.18697 type:complete len:142 (-) Transcript_26363:118-543(-)